MISITDDENWWDESWLDRNYSGAPDECSIHRPHRLNPNGNCSVCTGEQ